MRRATVDFPDAMPPVKPTSSRPRPVNCPTKRCYPRRAVSVESSYKSPEVLAATFLAEARDRRGLPAPGAPEIAIAGRSNVGKSTLLNRLAGRRALARTSKTPGRTRGIVFFDLDLGPLLPAIRLVDLPGYGYAKVARDERESWQALIEGYTRGRPTLALFAILIDARRGVEDEERQLYEWLGTIQVPAQIVFTKVDKLSASERGRLRAETQAMFKRAPAPAATTASSKRAAPILLSAETGEGVPALWSAIGAAAAALAPAPGREVATVRGRE
jgi:GTP-binding protein